MRMQQLPQVSRSNNVDAVHPPYGNETIIQIGTKKQLSHQTEFHMNGNKNRSARNQKKTNSSRFFEKCENHWIEKYGENALYLQNTSTNKRKKKQIVPYPNLMKRRYL